MNGINTEIHNTILKSTTVNEHQTKTHNTPCILSVNTDTPTMNEHDGRQPSSIFPYQQNQSGQPLTEIMKN